jgi:predicted enzyme related to lactoylglutathione lyase
VLNITFDCADARTVAAFWAAVTGWELHPEHAAANPEFSVRPARRAWPRLYFVKVPEPRAVKNRLHLDVVPRRTQAEEVARLVRLGARVLNASPGGNGWVVMADPEGNEFCVERVMAMSRLRRYDLRPI